MSDFEINSLEEYDQEVQKKNRKEGNNKTLLLVFVLFALFGFVVLLALPILRKNGSEKLTPVDINKMEIQNLYSYVTYGTRNVRYDIFLFNQKVDMNSFSNTEKFYYAFSFINEEDFINTKNIDSSSNHIYFLSDEIIEKNMKLFFGPNVTYSNNESFNYVFPFQIQHRNVANFTYVPEEKGYEATFTQFLKDDEYEPQYLTQLDSAYELENEEVILYEKVVYIELVPNGKKYDVLYYKDFNHSTLLGQNYNVSIEQIQNDWKQIEGCSYIEYHFALNNSYYYFVSSEIKDEKNP